MNKHLEDAVFEIAKVEAMMFAIEKAYLDLDVMPWEKERLDRGTYAFYALWDAVRKVADNLDLLSGDARVVDAIYAARDARQKSTLKTEK